MHRRLMPVVLIWAMGLTLANAQHKPSEVPASPPVTEAPAPPTSPPSPVLPPPGSLTTPPLAPNPSAPRTTTPPETLPQQQPPGTPPQQDQSRMPSIGGPTEIVLEARPMLILRGQSSWDDGFENLMEAFSKLNAAGRKAGLPVTGRPQAAFLGTDDFGFRFEAMITLENPPATPPAGLPSDIRVGQSPAGKALKFTHEGAYDDIDTTYEAITAYLDEKGLKARDIFIEEYLTDSKTSEDGDFQMNILVLIE